MKSFVLLALLVLLAIACADNFDRADTDQDGALSRREFGDWVSNLSNNIKPFLEPQSDRGAIDGSAGGSGVVAGMLAGSDLVSSTLNGLLIILVTELGDKTFFIAAILAMRHGRMVVYSGAMLALGFMHVLSCMMGLALPSLLPRKYTHFLSAVLFLYFGYRLYKDGQEMGDGPSEELAEAEEELGVKAEGEDQDDEENGKGKIVPAAGSFDAYVKSDSFKVFSQAFTLTFLAEWGDRSQIATIGLGATKNVWGIIIGGLVGHAFCTGLAVVGGKLLSTKISPKTIAFAGAGLFVIFGLHALFFSE
jgi:putative Ca2+/H+ antiporter (TMEM165/GDT1 family)